MQIARFGVEMFAASLVVLAAGAVSAQNYPSKPVRLNTASPGSGSDFVARQIASAISGPLGQSVVVDNRVTMQGEETVSKAPPDGHTLLVIGSSVWILPLLQKAPYEMGDFAPISLLAREVSMLVVHPSVPVKSVKELVALAKARPGELNYGSGPSGGGAHLSAELFKALAGVNIVRVPYKSGPAAMTGLISGEVQVQVASKATVAQHLESGRLRALAVTSAEPSPLVPGLPPVAAAVPGYESVSSTVMFAPAKTPDPIVRRLNQEIARALGNADVKERFFKIGMQTVGSSPEDLAAAMKSEMARMGKVIREAGIRVE